MGASQPVYFTIDNAAPTITILIPLQQTYKTADIVLTFIINKPASYLSYSLDNQREIQITGNITLPALSDGNHSIIIYAIDELGNEGTSDKVTFTITTFPILEVTTTITVSIIILAAIYLTFKRIKTDNKTLKTSLDIK
jgi:hypothetical protein